MKNERQEKILAIIAASAIETQEQLIDSLRKEGISCTQATISRDIKQLHLIKEPTGNGTYRYAVSTQKMRLNLADRLQTILRESIVSVDCAQNLVLIKTMAGLGPAAGAAFDGMDISAKVGTVAGDDTVLIVMRENESAAELCSAFCLLSSSVLCGYASRHSISFWSTTRDWISAIPKRFGASLRQVKDQWCRRLSAPHF